MTASTTIRAATPRKTPPMPIQTNRERFMRCPCARRYRRPRKSSKGRPFELFLGLRYLRAHGQRMNLSLFVWIGIGGVFLGVAALIVVLAVMTGFQDGIRDKIIAANPHILIFDTSGKGVADAGALAARVRGMAGVKAVTPFVLQQSLF